MRGEAQIVIPDSSNPRYCAGHLRVLFEREGLDEIVDRRGETIVCPHESQCEQHEPQGLGNSDPDWDDERELIEDLRREGINFHFYPIFSDLGNPKFRARAQAARCSHCGTQLES